jgi:hypothetical protein
MAFEHFVPPRGWHLNTLFPQVGGIRTLCSPKWVTFEHFEHIVLASRWNSNTLFSRVLRFSPYPHNSNNNAGSLLSRHHSYTNFASDSVVKKKTQLALTSLLVETSGEHRDSYTQYQLESELENLRIPVCSYGFHTLSSHICHLHTVMRGWYRLNVSQSDFPWRGGICGYVLGECLASGWQW